MRPWQAASVLVVTRLIHLNGPPGIGKSTISALYAHRHPGTLNLDIDALHRFVGGWEDPDNDTHRVLRPVARAMAATHLHGGRDVVLPQYLARPEEITAFEEVAARNGADFVELILLDTKEESIARFERRPDRSEWDEHNRRVVALGGGSRMLATMYDRLLEIARLRPAARLIRSESGAVENTYAQVLQALSEPPIPPGSAD
jgi:predicted kinase